MEKSPKASALIDTPCRESKTDPPPRDSDTPSSQKRFHRLRRLFTAKVLVASESALGLVIAALALVVAGTSLFQSREANRTAKAANALSEENNRINKKALAISEETAAGKRKLTLNATISTSPEFALSLKPTSGDFVLFDSQIEYMRLLAETVVDQTLPADKGTETVTPVPFTEETEQAGLHSLSRLHSILEDQIASARKSHKWRVQTLFDFDTADISGFFPLIIRVDYAYEGHRARSVFLYEIFYSGWPEQAGKNGKGIDLGKLRLVRTLEDNEDPTAILRERFQQWETENFTEDRSPSVTALTPSPAKTKPKSKKKPSKLHR